MQSHQVDGVETIETGLRGVPVGYCTTSRVDPVKGLFYHLHPIHELAEWEPEAVIEYLFKGKEPDAAELLAFKNDLIRRSRNSPDVLKQITKFDRRLDSMTLFSMALLAMEMDQVEKGPDKYREDALNIIARLPEVVATLINHQLNSGPTPASKPELGYMENFVHMLNIPNKNTEQLTHVMKLFNIMHYDHGGGNLSTFVGKCTSSGLASCFQSLSSAMNALAGPLHGGANRDCLAFLQSLLDVLGDDLSEASVEKEIRRILSEGGKIYGFGHAVLRVEDPRATVFFDYAKKHFSENALVKLALIFREAGHRVLAENEKIQNPNCNVDAISGTMLTAAGFPFAQFFTVLFGLARCVGILMQIIYERLEARGGKGTPIMRPKYIYKGRS